MIPQFSGLVASCENEALGHERLHRPEYRDTRPVGVLDETLQADFSKIPKENETPHKG